MVYRRTEKVETRQADTRADILDAARNQIAQHGFGGASMSAIAREADVATGTLYRYFENKDALFIATYKQLGEKEMDVIHRIATHSGPSSAVERLALAITTFISRALKSRRLSASLIGEPVSPQIDAARIKMRELHTDIYERIIIDGIKAGSLPEQNTRIGASAIAGAIVSVMAGPLAPENRPVDAQQIDEATKALITFCVAAIRPNRKSDIAF
ncbi:MAG: TetR/AcrR family transcriptional regulator [Alphaproteobacteria bacterium]